jgi:hypothetical protein
MASIGIALLTIVVSGFWQKHGDVRPNNHLTPNQATPGLHGPPALIHTIAEARETCCFRASPITPPRIP